MPQRDRLVLAGLTMLALVLRVATLDLQSFWADEVATVDLLRLDLSSMLDAIPDREGTPPAYYVSAWGWTQLFGTGEVGVRSLSALVGAAAVPVFYAAAADLCSRKVGLAVAALAAVNPILIWYSQEARAYSLMVLLGALSLWAFARMLRRPSRVAAGGWMLASGLAIATHYFAAFLVAAEAAWLLAVPRTRRQALPGVVGIVIVTAALIPLAVEQEELGAGSWITATGSLPYRLGRALKQFVLGFDSPLETAMTFAAAALVVAAVVLAVRWSDEPDRRGLGIAAALAAAAIGLPLVLASFGHDYVEARNLLVLWLPFAVVVAGGLVSRRAGRLGIAILVGLCLIQVVATISVFVEPGWQREDWRGAAAALGHSNEPRAVVVQPDSVEPVELYLGKQAVPARYASVREVVFITTAIRSGDQDHPDPPPRAPAPNVPGFREVERRYEETFTLIRLRAISPRDVSPAELLRHRLSPDSVPAVLLVRP